VSCPRSAGGIRPAFCSMLRAIELPPLPAPELVIERDGSGGNLCLTELAKERGRPVILHAGLSSIVLVDQHPPRDVQARPDVVLRHLEGAQGLPTTYRIAFRFWPGRRNSFPWSFVLNSMKPLAPAMLRSDQRSEQEHGQVHLNSTSSITTGLFALIECFRPAGM
jgi:hypothetical protein